MLALMKSIALAAKSHMWCHVPPSQLPQLGQILYYSKWANIRHVFISLQGYIIALLSYCYHVNDI